MVIGINSQTDNTEYRKLTKTPFLPDTPIRILPKNITDFYNDNFGFRNVLIKLYGTIKLNLFNTHPLYAGILGRDGWIFMNPAVFPDSTSWHRYAYFSDRQLRQIRDYLQAENDYLKELGIPYLIVIVPYKEQVYPEYYPYPNHIITKPLLDQFHTFLQQNSDLSVLDLREGLIKAKAFYPVYYHTDSHWNNWGAYVGYREIGKVLSSQNSNFHTFTQSEFDITPVYLQRWVGDLMRTSAKWKEAVPDVGIKMNLRPEFISKYPKLNSITIFGDSFADHHWLANREDFLEQFPELKDHLELIFTPPTNSKELRIKASIDDLVPIINHSIPDQKLAQRLIRYLINFRLQDDELVGLNYFFRLNFQNIDLKDRHLPLDHAEIERIRPQAVVREIIEQTLYSSFDQLVKF